MNADELVNVSEGLGWVADRLADLPEEKDNAANAVMICQLARLIVSELAHHLAHGVEPYEALRRTAVGELKVDKGTALVLSVLAAKAVK